MGNRYDDLLLKHSTPQRRHEQVVRGRHEAGLGYGVYEPTPVPANWPASKPPRISSRPPKTDPQRFDADRYAPPDFSWMGKTVLWLLAAGLVVLVGLGAQHLIHHIQTAQVHVGWHQFWPIFWIITIPLVIIWALIDIESLGYALAGLGILAIAAVAVFAYLFFLAFLILVGTLIAM